MDRHFSQGDTMKRNNTGLGKSNDKSKAVRDEIRAAELAMGAEWVNDSEEDGYAAHYDGTDVPRGGWAGWLEREISTHDEQQDEALHTRPSPNWPDSLLEAIAGQGRGSAAEACERNEIMRPCVHQDAYGSLVNEDGLCMFCGALGVKPPPTLDGIDQSEPATQPSEPLVEQQDIHSEPTHVGTIDARFEDGDGL